MANRNEAFAEWRKGIISDDNLKQVINDLERVVEVMEAMGETGTIIRCFRIELDAAKSMYILRRRA